MFLVYSSRQQNKQKFSYQNTLRNYGCHVTDVIFADLGTRMPGLSRQTEVIVQELTFIFYRLDDLDHKFEILNKFLLHVIKDDNLSLIDESKTICLLY